MLPKAEHKLLPIDDLDLDLNNPRIRKWIENIKGEPKAEEIYLALGAESGEEGGQGGTTFNSLRESIRTNRGIINPIIVNQEDDGRCVVVEGNTRLAIYREFRDEDTSSNDWDYIPCIIYKNLDLQQVDSIRLQTHLVGPRAWDPYSKAKYLHYLRTAEHMPFSSLVDYCGGKKNEVTNYINAYKDMETYYRPLIPDDGRFDHSRFSGFVELQKPNIKDAIISNNFNLSDFSQWIIDGKLYPLNTVRWVARILNNKEAKKVFLKKGAKEALKVIDSPDSSDDLSKAGVIELCKALITAIKKAQYEEIQHLQKDQDSDEVREILDLKDELNSFIQTIVGEV